MDKQLSRLWNTITSANDSTAKEKLGSIRTEWDSTHNTFKTYRYVQVAADTTVALGTVLGFTDNYKQAASLDRTDHTRNDICGIGRYTITASYYGWVQIKGYCYTVTTNGDDDIAKGDKIIIAATDGECDSVAALNAPGYKTIGIAVEDDRISMDLLGNTYHRVAVMLNID